MLVLEPFEERQTPSPHLLGGRKVARDAQRAPVCAQRLGAQALRHELGFGVVEEPLEPSDALVWILQGPQLLQSGRDLQPERDRFASQRPGDGAAEVVLLGESEVQPLPAGAELAGVEIRFLRDGQEVLGVSAIRVLGVRSQIEQLHRVLPDRVEHA